MKSFETIILKLKKLVSSWSLVVPQLAQCHVTNYVPIKHLYKVIEHIYNTTLATFHW